MEDQRLIDLGEMVEGGLEHIIMHIKSVSLVKVGGGGRRGGDRRVGRGDCINAKKII